MTKLGYVLGGLVALAVTIRAADEKKPEVKPRDASKKNLEDLANAFTAYHGKYNAFPPQGSPGDEGKPLLSWRVLVLPFLEQEALHKEFKPGEPWDSPHNKKLLAKMPKVFAPVAGDAKDKGATYYQVVVGKQAIYKPGAKFGPIMASVRDGLSNTLLIIEAADPVPWTKPADIVMEDDKPLPKFGGLFTDVIHGVSARGEVRTFRRDFDEKVMLLHIDPDDGMGLDFGKLLVKP